MYYLRLAGPYFRVLYIYIRVKYFFLRRYGTIHPLVAYLYIMKENGNKFVYGIIVLVVLAVLVLGYGVLRSTFTKTSPTATSTEQLPVEEMRIVTAKHQYKDATHTFAGEIVMPTPCDALSWTVATTTDATRISFITTSPAEVCAQVITSQRFKVSFRGSASTTVQATLDNAPIRLNIIEVGSEENLDNFEIYIKG